MKFLLQFLALFLALDTSAATYYVATNGNDSADGSIGTPWLRITNSLPKIAGGDTLNLRAGAYGEWIANTIPAGTSWSNATTLQAYNGEVVTINPAAPVNVHIISIIGSNKQYIVLSGLIIDGANRTTVGSNLKITYTVSGQPAHHIRVQNCTIKNAYDGHNVLITSGVEYVPTHCEFTNCIVSGGGFSGLESSPNHGFYISTSSNVIDGCTLYSNFNWGVHLYDAQPSGNVIKNSSFTLNGDGVGIFAGTNNQVFNNLFLAPDIGIMAIAYGQIDNTLVAYNTFYSNTASVVFDGPTSLGNVRVVNNLIASQSLTSYGAVQMEYGASTNSTITLSNNVMVGTGLPGRVYDVGGVLSQTVYSNNLTNQTAAYFVDAAAGNFTLLVDSPAINAGLALPEITIDRLGISRSDPSDVGTYEYLSVPVGIPGTVIAAKITTGNSENTFSIGDTAEMAGTPKHVATVASRNLIPAERRTEGMVAWVKNEGVDYRLVGGIDNTNWQAVVIDNSSLSNLTDSGNSAVVRSNLTVTGGGTDTPGLTVGGTRFVVTNTTVGIGTATPASLFHIVSGDLNQRFNGNSIEFERSGAGASYIDKVNAGDFMFRNGAGYVERLVIDGPTGNIGIGTNEPFAKLHVVGNSVTSGTNQAAYFVGNGSLLTGIGADGSPGVSTNQFTTNAVGSDVLGPVSFSDGIEVKTKNAVFSLTAASEATSKLVVHQNGDAIPGNLGFTGDWAPMVQLVGIDGADQGNIIIGDNLLRIQSNVEMTFAVSASGTPTRRMTILDTGAVGIGTATPAALLHLVSGDLNQRFNANSIEFERSGAGASYIDKVNAGDFTFRNGAGYVSRLTIDGPTGNIGIGTDAPSTTLEVVGTITGNGAGIYGNLALASNAVVITASGGATSSTSDGGRTYNIDVTGGGGSITNFGVTGSGANTATTNGTVVDIFTSGLDPRFTSSAGKITSGSNTFAATTIVSTKVFADELNATNASSLTMTAAGQTLELGSGGLTLSGSGAGYIGPAGNATIDASGFNGVLATSDNTIQEALQKLDDLSVGGASLNHVLTALSTNNAQGTLTNANPTNLFGAGVIPIAKLATGTPDGSKFIRDDGTLQAIPGGGDALVANPLSQFAETTSAQLRGVLSDEDGTGVFLTANGSGSSLTAVNAITGDSATAFFSTGTLEDARLSANVSLLGSAIDLSGAEATGALAAGRFPALTGDVTTTAGSLATTIAANSVALTTDTTGNYAAGDAEAGAALTGDSATAFFSTGTLEPALMATNAAFSNAWLRATSATTAEWSRNGSGLTNIAGGGSATNAIPLLDGNGTNTHLWLAGGPITLKSDTMELFDADGLSSVDWGLRNLNGPSGLIAHWTDSLFHIYGDVQVDGTSSFDAINVGTLNVTNFNIGFLVVSNTASIRTNIGQFDVSTTAFVIGTRYTNSTRRAFVTASFQLSAAAAGTAAVSLRCEQSGVTNRVNISAGPLASLSTVEQLSLMVGPDARYYFVDDTSGTGASVSIVAGTSSRTDF